MKIIRPSSFEEFVNWYLKREAEKHNQQLLLSTIEEMREKMKEKHSGKIRPWFEEGIWHIIELERKEEIESLVCLDGKWTRKAGLLNPHHNQDYRLLKILVKNACKNNYFDNHKIRSQNGEEFRKRQKYIEQFRKKMASLW